MSKRPSAEDANVAVDPEPPAKAAPDAGAGLPEVGLGEVDATSALRIHALVPNLARPGETVIVIGHGFVPQLECHVAGMPAGCEVADESRLELHVPGSLLVDRCRLDARVELRHPTSGQSVGSALELVRPGPSYTLSAALRPAQVLELAVTGLGPFAVTLGGRPVPALPNTEAPALPNTEAPTVLTHALTLEVPEDIASGKQLFQVHDQCGESSKTITVLDRPSIERGPPTLAPGGVALLAVAGLQPDDVVGVRIGDESIAPTNGAAMQWVSSSLGMASPASAAGPLIAIRAPSQLSPGPARFELSTRYGVLEWPLEVLEPQGPYPQSPAGILGISPAASGVFPISTISASGLVTDAQSGAAVSHEFEYRLTLRSAGRQDCPIARAGKGEIYGEERVQTSQASHPVVGEYELHAEANRVRLIIDRTSSGGVAEEYLGGWVSYPDAVDPYEVELPPPDQRAAPLQLKPDSALLLLTSQLTGRQLLIDRELDDKEEQTRVRSCMMELP